MCPENRGTYEGKDIVDVDALCSNLKRETRRISRDRLERTISFESFDIKFDGQADSYSLAERRERGGTLWHRFTRYYSVAEVFVKERCNESVSCKPHRG